MSDDLGSILKRIIVSEDGLQAEVDGHEIRVDHEPDMLSSLTNAIYQRIHCGSHADRLPVRVRNPALISRLEQQLGERLTSRTGSRISPQVDESTDELEILLDGLRVRVPVDRISDFPDDKTVTVQVSRLRPMLSPGFFVALGEDPPEDPVTRVYIRGEDPFAQVDTFVEIVEMLDDRAPYRAKVLTMVGQYPRTDAIVLYLYEPDERLLNDIVAIAKKLQVTDIVSPFTRRIGPGVSVASEPSDNESGAVRSFGEHRAHALAKTLLELESGSETAAAVQESIANSLQEMAIDPLRLELNWTPSETDNLIHAERG